MNDLDTIMDLDPVELSKDPKQIDRVIAYYRNYRAQRASGGKKAQKESGPVPKLEDILGLAAPKPTAEFKRRA